MKRLSFFFSYLMFLIHSFAKGKVLFVFEVFRHGARGPLRLKNNLDVLAQHWDNEQELTNSGMREHYLLGQTLRQRYIINNSLLNPNFNPNEVYLYVTDRNRTIQTAYSQLSGLFPYRSEFLTDSQIAMAVPPMNISDLESIQTFLGGSPIQNNFQTLPMHVLDNGHPFNLAYKCTTGISKLTKDNTVRMNTEIQQVMNDFNTQFKESLKKSLNKTDEDFHKWSQICDYSDAFISDDFEKRDLNNLSVDLNKFNESAKVINGLDFKIFDNTSIIAKVTVTPTVRQMISYMNTQIKGSSGPKMVLFSAHDTNIVLWLNFLKSALNLTDLHFTNIVFASNVILELNKNDDSDSYFVNVLYNGNQIYNNTLESFSRDVSAFYSTEADYQTVCGSSEKEEPKSNRTVYIVVISILSFLIVALLFILVKLIRNNKTEGDDNLVHNV